MIIIIVVAIVVLAAIAVVGFAMQRRHHLRQRFGDEYDRAVSQHPRREAEKELAEREKRHSQLDVRPLSASVRDRYAQRWALVQEQFVDRPGPSVDEADRLVTALMAERGYPTDGYEQQYADLSVEHSTTIDHYRAAHEVKTHNERGQQSTERLRAAMVHYRALFEDLLGPAGHRPNAI
ncbi:MAG TPA: hypothetical protein VM677_33160 [Actinokineospora sp.]|nr:hypothetical protein [Actinokineospora sp.]